MNVTTDSLFPEWPQYPQEAIDAVSKVLKSGKSNQWGGQEVGLFEKEYADYLGVDYCVAVANGSNALELAWRALGIKFGDEVIVTCRSFIASASSIIICGGIPVFVDVDENTQNLDPEKVAKAVTPDTRAILCVHLAGCPCEMDKLLAIAKKHKLKLVEDCAQSHGARYRGKPLGTIGDIGCFSFCQNKIITTGGEGGMVAMKDKTLWRKVWSFKDHGRNLEKINNLKWSSNFPYFYDSIGTNYRMTEMQAAIGRVMLKKLDEWVNTRRKYAAMLDQLLKNYEFIRVPEYPEHLYHSFYEYYAFSISEKLPKKWNSGKLLDELQVPGLDCKRGVCPELYLEEAFEKVEYPDESVLDLRLKKRLPVAKKLADNSLRFVIHPAYSTADMEQKLQIIKSVLDKVK
jgi:dTDP-4-amino-4,6-dideoxygalactose transaminase